LQVWPASTYRSEAWVVHDSPEGTVVYAYIKMVGRGIEFPRRPLLTTVS